LRIDRRLATIITIIGDIVTVDIEGGRSLH
jgi:hypothetical protein